MADECHPQTLISTRTSDVQFCEDCGMYHLNMGPLTLRLNQEYFTDLANDLSMAIAQQKLLTKTKSSTKIQQTGSNVRKLHS
jgi:hypothetical protein